MLGCVAVADMYDIGAFADGQCIALLNPLKSKWHGVHDISIVERFLALTFFYHISGHASRFIEFDSFSWQGFLIVKQ